MPIDNPYANVDVGEESRVLERGQGLASADGGQRARPRATARSSAWCCAARPSSTAPAAPPWGPVDIVVENDRIAALVLRGDAAPAPSSRLAGRPPADHEVDCHGRFVTPGLRRFRMPHIGTPYHLRERRSPAGRLHLQAVAGARRDHGARNGLDATAWAGTWTSASASGANEIAAPRILAYVVFPAVNDIASRPSTRRSRAATGCAGSRRAGPMASSSSARRPPSCRPPWTSAAERGPVRSAATMRRWP